MIPWAEYINQGPSYDEVDEMSERKTKVLDLDQVDRELRMRDLAPEMAELLRGLLDLCASLDPGWNSITTPDEIVEAELLLKKIGHE